MRLKRRISRSSGRGQPNLRCSYLRVLTPSLAKVLAVALSLSVLDAPTTRTGFKPAGARISAVTLGCGFRPVGFTFLRFFGSAVSLTSDINRDQMCEPTSSARA